MGEDEFKDGQHAMLLRHDSVDSPPLAWVIIFKNRYINPFDGCVPDAIRRWGYVFWDAGRLDTGGAKDCLVAEWEALHEIIDPRDRKEAL